MSQEEKKSLFDPVGKAQKFRSMNGEITMTLAIFDASQVPEGSDLYVQPKDSRLKLEIEVANDNALHWQQNLRLAHASNKVTRADLRRARDLLERVSKFKHTYTTVLDKEIEEFLKEEM